jgi:hypothetical protein
MFNTNISQKGKSVAWLVVLAFALAGLTAVTSLSDSSVVVVAQGLGNVSDPSVVEELSGLSKHPHLTPGNVSDSSAVAQSQGNDPNDCFRTNDNIDQCPVHSFQRPQ